MRMIPQFVKRAEQVSLKVILCCTYDKSKFVDCVSVCQLMKKKIVQGH